MLLLAIVSLVRMCQHGFLPVSSSLRCGISTSPATSVNNTTYIGKFSVGTTHFIWTVIQSDLTDLFRTLLPPISGTASVNSTITSSSNLVTGGTATYSLDWVISGRSRLTNFDPYFDLVGETTASYTIVSADASTYLRCAVSMPTPPLGHLVVL